MFDQALLFDSDGNGLTKHPRVGCRDWDEVNAFCHSVYVPFQVRPIGRSSTPNATLIQSNINSLVLSRFSFGVPTYLWDFDQNIGKILVYTLLKNPMKHGIGRNKSVTTASGESFVVDFNHAESYWTEGDNNHLNLNLTIPHEIIEKTALKWFDFTLPKQMWQTRTNFGGSDSPWVSLLDYAVRMIGTAREQVEKGRIGIHLEEALAVELLRSWAERAGVSLSRDATGAAPYYVRRAESYIEANAINVPTIAEIATVAGVSVRSLSEGFRRFRGMTPGAFLREQRLKGARQDLLAQGRDITVASVASRWGYVNFGTFAHSYFKRFGEHPSTTQRRCGTKA